METAAIIMLIAGAVLLVLQTIVLKDKKRKELGQ